MSAAAVWHLILWVHFLALSLWAGGIFFTSAIGAPAVHKSMASKALAGQIVGRMLKRLNSVELFCCFMLLITSFSAYRFVPEQKDALWKLLAGFILMGLITIYYTFRITPQIEALKERVPALEVGTPAKAEFDRLHKRYVALIAVNGGLALALLYQSVVLF